MVIQEAIEFVKAVGKSDHGVDLTDGEALEAMRHIKHLVQTGAPETRKTISLGVKKYIFAQIIKGKL